jgi:hypothetical protein
MARTHLVFGDIEGKLDVLCVDCTQCDRKGHKSYGRFRVTAQSLDSYGLFALFVIAITSRAPA